MSAYNLPPVPPVAADSPHLSQIDTRWSLLARAAQRADEVAARQAQAELLPRYYPAVHRYLSAAVRDPSAADDLCQEFALRFVRGDFRHAHPDKGRFRDYLKTALFHLVEQHRRRAAGKPLPGPAVDAAGEPDRVFLEQWRRDVLNQAWDDLAAEGGSARPTLFDVLRRKADEPGRTSAELAAVLGAEFGRPLTAENVRQMVHRGRERFAACLRRVAAAAVGTTDPAEVDAELAELGLLEYCR